MTVTRARIGETRFDRLLEGDALFHRAHTRPLNQAYSSFDRVEALQRDVEKRSSDPSLSTPSPVKLDGTRGACSTSRISPSLRRRFHHRWLIFATSPRSVQRTFRGRIRLTSLGGSQISRYTVALITVIYRWLRITRLVPPVGRSRAAAVQSPSHDPQT